MWPLEIVSIRRWRMHAGTTPTEPPVLHDHLELAADIYAVELEGRSSFAF
jgi:hypothetical protein